jgi:hypothetical protein
MQNQASLAAEFPPPPRWRTIKPSKCPQIGDVVQPAGVPAKPSTTSAEFTQNLNSLQSNPKQRNELMNSLKQQQNSLMTEFGA